uniref:Uncharacterized protein n=1 Tax=Rhizophagus irregularis (strain DAOM 181602 / DAOM 197198 / MUCL 43194) TaxID=747089 RepID=U9UJF6_RHIID
MNYIVLIPYIYVVGGNGIYVDSESIYVDTGCWPELMHGAGLEFRNAGQNPISTVYTKVLDTEFLLNSGLMHENLVCIILVT